jgi:putative DNA primase/helicase
MNFTDLGNAERLIKRYGKELRYCHPWGKFFVWDGMRWKADENGATERRAKETVRAMYEYAGTLQDKEERKALASWALKSESAARLSSMLSLAQSEPEVPVAPEQFDADPWLFNCLDGVIDIRTGEVTPPKPEQYITKLAPWHYDPTPKCPSWLEHLALVMDGDIELINFLQRAYGSCLTGIIDDRKIFIQWGSGKNGKSICNEAISMVLGEYAMRTPTDTLLVKRGEQVPNDLARLKGARFVFASESENGRRLSESLVKDLTGGERIIARFLHQEFFEFRPTFKLWLSTNNKPEIRGADEGIWDRICLIPFDVRIPSGQEKKRYEIIGAFEEEAPGILGWLVEGAYEWYRNGLNPPEKVRAAVQNYREEMDELAAFFEENCILVKEARAKTSELYKAYTEWVEKTGEKPLSKKAFSGQLALKGCKAGKVDGARGWHGVGLLAGWTA